MYINVLAVISSFLYAHYAAYRHEDGENKKYVYLIETSFLIDFGLQFILSYPDPRGELFEEIKDLEMIANRYLHGLMLEHAFPLIPFWLLSFSRNREKLLYITKLIRLKRGLLNVNVSNVMDFVKHYQKHKLEILIKNDPELAQCQDTDNTKIDQILKTTFALRIIKIMLFVLSCSYFFAMSFKMLTDI